MAQGGGGGQEKAAGKMNYRQALRFYDDDIFVHEMISGMRAHALFRGSSAPVALMLARAKVKRRVAKRWATRLLREGLPRSARFTGPRTVVRNYAVPR